MAGIVEAGARIPAEIVRCGKCLVAKLSAVINDIKNSEHNIDELTEAMGVLQGDKDELVRKIDTRRNIWHGEPRVPVINWLPKVENLKVRVDKTKEEFDHGMKDGCLGDFFCNIFIKHRLSKKAKELLQLVKNYEAEYNDFTDADLVTELGPGVIAERPSGVGMSSKKAYEELKNHIRNHDASIVVIHGIGGVRKSELVERLNREMSRIRGIRTKKVEAEEEPLSFDGVFWIDANGMKGEKEVQMAVVDQMKLHHQTKEKTQKEIAACIYDKMEKNKYLVVLNDVWRPIDLSKV